MPFSAVHMCLEYLINFTDVAMRLLRGGTEGWRNTGKEGVSETDKKMRYGEYK